MWAAWILCLAALLTWLTAAQEPVADRPPYELDTYYVAFLKRGPKALGMPKEEAERIQEAHMAHIRRMADEEVLVGAGPFSDDGELRGIFIFKVASLEEAQRWTADDPAVKAGRLVMDLHGWMGPKGIGAPYKARMKADPSSKPQMRTYQFGIFKRGPKFIAGDTPALRELVRRHLGRVTAETREGVLLAAGPFTGESDWLGLLFYDLPTTEAARARAEQDPFVKAGHATVEVHPLFMDSGVLPVPAPGA
jgi:uncharacterized protein YciI